MNTPAETLDVASALRLRRVAVAFQFHAECDVARVETDYSATQPYCERFFSYEKDLLSHAFRQPAPVQSRCLPAGQGARSQTCDVMLAPQLAYVSEGTPYVLKRRGPASLPARLSASRSDFPQSGHSILHLVVHIDVGEDDARTFGEYEVLSLTKLWCPADDSEFLTAGAARFRLDAALDPCELDLPALACRLFPRDLADAAAARRALAGGCVQIVFGDGGDNASMHGAVSADALFAVLHASQQETPPADVPTVPDPVLKAVGGLVQNIVDLRNVDVSELGDMLDGVCTSTSTITAVHRGTLLSMNIEDRLFDHTADSIGISPYLLLPQAALLHNERLLFTARRMLRTVDALLQPIDTLRQHDRMLDANQAPRRAAHAALNPMREQLVQQVLTSALDDLPGGPDSLIRFTVRRLWQAYRRLPDPDVGRHRCIEFVAEADLALRHGLVDVARTQLNALLDRDYLGNVFQYRSERWIFDAGSEDRGLNSLQEALRRRLAELDTLIGQEQERRSEWFNTNLTVIALVFTLLQIVPFNGLGEWLGLPVSAPLAWSSVVFDVCAGLLFLLLLLGRRVDALIYMRALVHAGRSLAEKVLRAPA
ncbi:MAG: hypothetical protein AB1418_00615 [Pseudomonadota bacterium]